MAQLTAHLTRRLSFEEDATFKKYEERKLRQVYDLVSEALEGSNSYASAVLAWTEKMDGIRRQTRTEWPPVPTIAEDNIELPGGILS